ncbi:lactoylglutathione lyase, GloA [Mycobacteroides abscessus subsp. massiliense]|nr:lactoylglutathione lyase, GloA [Mycobacteroides abscessus subsp. massiliense]
MLQTPDGHGRIELFEYIHPEAIASKPTRPNDIGMHRVAFSVDDIDEAIEIAARHGCHPLRGVATYEDVYKLTYRGERYPWQVAVESCAAAVFSTLTLPLTIKRHVASAPADWALTKYGGSVISLVKVQVQVR